MSTTPVCTRVEYLGNKTFRVRAYVDAQNGFVAEIRNHYTCTVKDAGGDRWTLENLSIK